MNPFKGLLVGLLLLGSACAGPATQTSHFSDHGEPFSSIYVVNHGWHTGLVVKRADIPLGLVPEAADFTDADYLELGWGDWDYYQSGDPGLWLTLKAALWPTASVLHVVGVQGTVADRFAGYEIIRLDVAQSGFARLADYLDRSFARDGVDKARPISPGFGSDSLFYPARGKFHLFNTCNTWTARALKAAGYPLGLFEPILADQLMAKVRSFAAITGHAKPQAPSENLKTQD
jgi:uncharacterized protein (TIGR02117 family)